MAKAKKPASFAVSTAIGRDASGRIVHTTVTPALAAAAVAAASQPGAERGIIIVGGAGSPFAAGSVAGAIADGVGTAGSALGGIGTRAPIVTGLTLDERALTTFLDGQRKSLASVFRTVDRLGKDLGKFFPRVPPTLPGTITGQIVGPDGAPGAGLSIEASRPTFEASENVPAFTWPARRVATDERGFFTLALPKVPVPNRGLALVVRGRDGQQTFALPRTELLDSNVGVLGLERPLLPLSEGLVGKIRDRLPASEEDVEARPDDFAAQEPEVRLGEPGNQITFPSSSGAIDRFRYSALLRLVEPQLGQANLVATRPAGNRLQFFPLASHLDGLRTLIPDDVLGSAVSAAFAGMRVELRDRVAIDRPIDITDFYEQLERNPGAVPKAATLGIGYVVSMRQSWIPAGYSLGDLVYSLPLAPGEEQRIAVFERREETSVSERESLTDSETVTFREQADSSAKAVFDASAHETLRAGSSMSARSGPDGRESGSRGGGGLFDSIGDFFEDAAETLTGGLGMVLKAGSAGGHDGVSSSGKSSSWQDASRDLVSSSSQDLHSSLNRRAAATRQANRTGIRMARASDNESVTTRIIANHNHSHALTLQYWEVLRRYTVASQVDDVQLVCFVPMELVAWLPAGQPRELPTEQAITRDGLLRRYALLLRYLDVVADRVRFRPELRQGARLLRDLAADPTMLVEAAAGQGQDVVDVTITGTYLPFEDYTVSLVLNDGSRTTPQRLLGPAVNLAGSEFHAKEQVIGALSDLRRGGGVTRSVQILLPPGRSPSDVLRLEVRRNWRTFQHQLGINNTLAQMAQSGAQNVLGAMIANIMASLHVSLAPHELEARVGPPRLWDIRATASGGQAGPPQTLLAAYPGAAHAVEAGGMLVVPAGRLPARLGYKHLLRVEMLFQHVVRNTVEFSRAVWRALTSEERAILLERFTIGVPEDGVADVGDEIPLLNCVGDSVQGFYGNCMVLPFQIPAALARKTEMTSRDMQDALLRFHRQAFVPPKSSITLPTRGVLAEAVMGVHNASEKVDLTRFWNWKDSPHTSAADPSSVLGGRGLGQGTVAGTLAGPSMLPGSDGTGRGLEALINAPRAAQPDLAGALIGMAPSFGANPNGLNLTGLDTLGASMRSATDAYQAQRMAELAAAQARAAGGGGGLFGGLLGGTPLGALANASPLGGLLAGGPLGALAGAGSLGALASGGSVLGAALGAAAGGPMGLGGAALGALPGLVGAMTGGKGGSSGIPTPIPGVSIPNPLDLF